MDVRFLRATGLADDAIAVTAAESCAVLGQLQGAMDWRAGDPAVMVVMNPRYDVPWLAFVLAD